MCLPEGTVAKDCIFFGLFSQVHKQLLVRDFPLRLFTTQQPTMHPLLLLPSAGAHSLRYTCTDNLGTFL
jgi:hypothetical protein